MVAGTNSYPLGAVNIVSFGNILLSNATWVQINVPGAGTVQLVPASTNPLGVIKVVQMFFVCANNNVVNLQSSTTAAISDGPQSYIANGGVVLPFSDVGWFDTGPGEALNMVTTQAATVGGNLKYVYV